MPSSGIRFRRSELAVRDSSTPLLQKVPRARAGVVLVILKFAVEQDDRKRARGPIVAAMRELGWSACSGYRASMASLGTGAAASSSR
jgi:hypothetical protein